MNKNAVSEAWLTRHVLPALKNIGKTAPHTYEERSERLLELLQHREMSQWARKNPAPYGIPGNPLGIASTPRRTGNPAERASAMGVYYTQNPRGAHQMKTDPGLVARQAVNGLTLSRAQPHLSKDRHVLPNGQMAPRAGLAQVSMVNTLENKPRDPFSRWAAKQDPHAVEDVLSNPHTAPADAIIPWKKKAELGSRDFGEVAFMETGLEKLADSVAENLKKHEQLMRKPVKKPAAAEAPMIRGTR